MSRLWKRNVKLAAGIAGMPTARSWEGFQIAFTVFRTDKRSANKSEIQIWNLNETNRAFLDLDRIAVVLAVSHGATPTTILFSGDVDSVKHEHTETDVVTTINAGDGLRAFQGAWLNTSFGSGTTNVEVLTRAVQSAGLAVGHIALEPSPYLQGMVASGMVRDVLDEVCGMANATWSIQDGALQVLGKDEGTNQIAVVVRKSTGLVGTPQRLRGRGKQPKRKGVKFTMLLNPLLRPGGYVLLDSREFKGYAIVKRVKHVGESRGEPFYSEVETSDVMATPAPSATITVPPGTAAGSSWWSDLVSEIL